MILVKEKSKTVRSNNILSCEPKFTTWWERYLPLVRALAQQRLTGVLLHTVCCGPVPQTVTGNPLCPCSKCAAFPSHIRSYLLLIRANHENGKLNRFCFHKLEIVCVACSNAPSSVSLSHAAGRDSTRTSPTRFAETYEKLTSI
jgi:hypothetical protein